MAKASSKLMSVPLLHLLRNKFAGKTPTQNPWNYAANSVVSLMTHLSGLYTFGYTKHLLV